MACRSFMAVSLDGFIARRDGSIDWLARSDSSDSNDYGYGEFIKGIDALVMGRRTFETVLGFGEWPYRRPVFVLSRSARIVPAHLKGKAEFLALEPEAAVGHLAAVGFHELYVDGGVTVQGFLAAGLLNELTLTTVPILIGSGYRLFGNLDGEVDCRLLASTAFPNGYVQSSYRLNYLQ